MLQCASSSQVTFHMEVCDNKSKNSFLPQCIHHWEDRERRKCHPHETGSCTNTQGRGRRLKPHPQEPHCSH